MEYQAISPIFLLTVFRNPLCVTILTRNIGHGHISLSDLLPVFTSYQ